MLKKVFGRYFQDKNIAILLIFAVAIMARFVWLDRFPVGMAHDEVEYTLSSKTYHLAGKDLSGFSFPLSLFRTQTEGRISALPPIILSFYFASVPINQLTARIPFVFVNLATALVLYLLVDKLFSNKSVSFIAALFFLINPWSFYYSRWAAEAPVALLFYLIGILMMLSLDKNKLILSYIFLILGFFSYHGAKPIFLPLIVIGTIYRIIFEEKKKISKKSGWLFIGLAILFIAIYLAIDLRLPGEASSGRYQDVLLLDRKFLASVVDDERRVSIFEPFSVIFSNKLTVAMKEFVKKYMSAFSPDTLFLSGDYRATYRFGDHGLFYIIDILFLCVGLLSLYSKNKKSFILILSFVLVSPLTTALSNIETSVINRSFLLMPMLVIISSLGIVEIYNCFKKRNLRTTSYLVITFLVLISFTNFLNFYFLRFPVSAQENYFLSERVLAKFLKIHSDGEGIKVISSNPRAVYLETVFYSKPKLQEQLLNNFLENSKKKTYSIGNVEFTDVCPQEFFADVTYIVHREVDCHPRTDYVYTIQDQKDAGTIFAIYNDEVCKDELLTPWRREHLISDYQIEEMDRSTFCNRWINI